MLTAMKETKSAHGMSFQIQMLIAVVAASRLQSLCHFLPLALINLQQTNKQMTTTHFKCVSNFDFNSCHLLFNSSPLIHLQLCCQELCCQQEQWKNNKWSNSYIPAHQAIPPRIALFVRWFVADVVTPSKSACLSDGLKCDALKF